jgi:hypothetical protein
MNFIQKGLAWVEQRRTTSLSEPVTVITSSITKQVDDVTVLEPESNVNSEGVRVQSHIYKFLMKKTPDLDFKRGVRIRRHLDKQLYEVVINKKLLEEYDDPNNQRIVIPAKLCSTQS